MATPTDFLGQISQAPPVSGAAFQQGQQIGQSFLNAQQTGIQNQGTAQDNSAKQQVFEAAKAKAILDAQRQVQLRQEMATLSENPSAEAIDKFLLRNPQLAEQYKGVHDRLDKSEQEQRLIQSSQVYAALRSGNDDVAKEVANSYADAYDGAGRKQDANHLRNIVKQIDANPKTAAAMVGGYLVANGGEKYGQSLAELESAPAVVAAKQAQADKAVADADAAQQDALLKTDQILADIGVKEGQAERFKAQSKDEAGRLQLGWAEYALKKADAARKAQAGVLDLKPDVKKSIEADAGAATAASQLARKGVALAADFKEKAPIGGVGGVVRDTVAGTLGVDTDASALNQQYIEIRNSLIRAARKPGEGPMSDADFRVAAAAYPGENASPAAKARTLERLAAEAEVSGDLHAAAARFRALTGGPGASSRPVVVNGVEVPAGTDLGTFNATMDDELRARRETKTATSKKAVHDEAASLGGTPVGD